MRHLRLTALACASVLLPSSLALAQDPAPVATESNATSPAEPKDSVDADAESRPTPPRLLERVEPIYPDSQRASGPSAHVGLVLTLDDAGNVTDASVIESGGADF